jgi:hypothetical protein
MRRKLKFGRTLSMTILCLALVAITVDCEQNTNITVTLEDKAPPTFSIAGPWWVVDFGVEELPQIANRSLANPFTLKGETLWKISAPGRIRATAWPAVTYGDIPQGFSQTIPVLGPPPEFVEGKLYAVRAVDSNGPQGLVLFEVHNNKAINVTNEFFK